MLSKFLNIILSVALILTVWRAYELNKENTYLQAELSSAREASVQQAAKIEVLARENAALKKKLGSVAENRIKNLSQEMDKVGEKIMGTWGSLVDIVNTELDKVSESLQETFKKEGGKPQGNGSDESDYQRKPDEPEGETKNNKEGGPGVEAINQSELGPPSKREETMPITPQPQADQPDAAIQI